MFAWVSGDERLMGVALDLGHDLMARAFVVRGKNESSAQTHLGVVARDNRLRRTVCPR